MGRKDAGLSTALRFGRDDKLMGNAPFCGESGDTSAWFELEPQISCGMTARGGTSRADALLLKADGDLVLYVVVDFCCVEVEGGEVFGFEFEVEGF